MATIIRAAHVHHVYQDGTELRYEGIDFTVERGERVALLGPNGSGKTTLLFHLVGLLKPTHGTVRVFGVDPADQFEQIRRRIGVVLQDPDQQIIAATVEDDIAFSPRNYGFPEREVERRVHRVAAEFEIEHLMDKLPHYLSGGEKTKVALAGALVMDPELLVLDEPFEGLDTMSKAELASLLSRLHAERGVSILVSTHEVNLMPEFVDTIYLMGRRGTMVARGTPRELFASPDLLERHHLEPPILAALFQALRERGIPVEGALTVQEAADELARLVQGPRKRRAA